MKNNHTKPCTSNNDALSSASNPKERILIEDMSVCSVSDTDETKIEELLIDDESAGSNKNELDELVDKVETNETLDVDIAIVPTVKPLSLYKCSECSFGTTTTGELKDHKNNKHEKAKENILGDFSIHVSHVIIKQTIMASSQNILITLMETKLPMMTLKDPISLKVRQKMIYLRMMI